MKEETLKMLGKEAVTAEELAVRARGLSMRELKEAVRELVSADAMVAFVERKDLETAYVKRMVAVSAGSEEELGEMVEWASGRSMNDLIAIDG